MSMSRKMAQAVAYERLSYKSGLTDRQRETYLRRARQLRSEDARNKATIARFKSRMS